MLRKRGLYILLLLFLVLSNLSAKAFQDIDQDPLPFPETGHWVSGEFLDFYQSVDDPRRIFGLPITEVFEDPIRENIQIQYFERVRMELDPSKPEGERVSLANLGKWLYDETQRGTKVDLPVNNPLCRHFPKNDKYVCFGFLQLYDRYNGQEYFGEPVSDVEYVNNRLVQYFERVRMEWRNELPVNQKVVLTEIGRIDYDRRIGDSVPDKRVYFPKEPVVPTVRAFVDHPLLPVGHDQVVYILVRDQFFRPVEGAQVEITIFTNKKDPINLSVRQPTNEDGLTSEKIKIPSVSPNQVVEIRVKVRTLDKSEGEGETWFRTWW